MVCTRERWEEVGVIDLARWRLGGGALLRRSRCLRSPAPRWSPLRAGRMESEAVGSDVSLVGQPRAIWRPFTKPQRASGKAVTSAVARRLGDGPARCA